MDKKNQIAIVKKAFYGISTKEAKITAARLFQVSQQQKRDFSEVVNEYKAHHDKKREEGLPLLLKHCLITAILVETNDSLKGTYFDGYYNKIIGTHGRAFMNAQNRLYFKEFDALAGKQTTEINDLIRFKEIVIDAMALSFDEDFEKLAEVIQIWGENTENRKRIYGIAQKINKK